MGSAIKTGVFLGNSLDLLRDLPDGCADLILTDPPYGVEYQSNYPPEEFKKPVLHGDDMASEKERRAIFKQVGRVLRPGGCALVFGLGGGGHTPNDTREMLEAFGLDHHNVLVWDKMDMGHGWGYRYQWEAILMSYKTGGTKVWNGGHCRGNVLRYPVCGNLSPWQSRHPTPKPLSLMLNLVRDNSNPGDLVVDPFAGTGSALVAAHVAGRRAWGCEIDPGFHAAAYGWLEREAAQPDLFAPAPAMGEQTEMFA